MVTIMSDDFKERHYSAEVERETKMIDSLEKAGRQDIADLFREKLEEKIAENNK